MEKLKFLAGTWRGEAVVSHGETPITLRQTEEVQYKLGGLVLVIEGTGRDEAGKVMLNALAVASFDPQSNSYRIRAWNGGNTVESELKVSGNSFESGISDRTDNNRPPDDDGRAGPLVRDLGGYDAGPP